MVFVVPILRAGVYVWDDGCFTRISEAGALSDLNNLSVVVIWHDWQ